MTQENILYIQERILMISASRGESELALAEAATEYPSDPAFENLRKDIDSMFNINHMEPDPNEHVEPVITTMEHDSDIAPNVEQDDPTTDSPKTTNPHTPKNDKGKGIATDGSDVCGLKKRNVDFTIPTFDLGISPKKTPKSNWVRCIPERETKNPKRATKPGDKLRSPYMCRAVSFDTTTEERKPQDWVLRSSGCET